MANHHGMSAFPSLQYDRGGDFAAAFRSFYLQGGEPPIEEVMADDVTRKVMACDGVAADQLRSLMTAVRSRLL